MAAAVTRIALSFALTALAGVGCGGRSFTNGDDQASGATGTGGGGSQGGAALGGGAQGGSQASAGSQATGGGSGGSVAKCDHFLDETGPQLTVLLRNETAGPIYIGPQKPTCGLGGDVYQVSDATGRLLSGPRHCDTTCEQLYQGTVAPCSPTTCPVSAVITLLPGEAALQSWTATFMETAKLPPACFTPDGGTSCQHVVSIKPGDYFFTAQAGTQIDCSPFGGTCMKCVRDSNGGCTTAGAVIGGQLLAAKLLITLDASYGVGGPGGGMQRPIEIVFGK